MPSTEPSKKAIWTLFAACALSLALAGCTVKPPVVRAAGPSLDAGVANSGILAILPSHGYLVTPLFNARYGALVTLYGAKLIPPMTSPQWIMPCGTNFIITADGLAAFALLSFYARQHQTP